jgi:hypothetical protein
VFLLSDDEELRLVFPTGEHGFSSINRAVEFAADALVAADALDCLYAFLQLENGERADVDHVFEVARDFWTRYKEHTREAEKKGLLADHGLFQKTAL